ncbi:MAG: tRNA pseudouridine(13) synthase TruD [Planctomycetes bacterium]|nr:tRNA pseudouridine(13) synthase TruD [Planctomycetota bacterium]
MLPFVTNDLPGTGGVSHTSDRVCEEVLAKQPAATGDHLWLKVSKSGLGTQQARAAIARAGAVSIDFIECGGNRDRHGRSVQWFSVPANLVENPGALRRAGTQGKMSVLELTASHKPVTPAHISRLHWKVRIRGANRDGGYHRAKAILDHLRRGGLPNFVPLSCFGREASFVKWGRMLLQGRRLPAQVASTGVDEHRCLRSVQESLFDRYLSSRVEDGKLATCLEGDVVENRQGEVSVVAFREHVQKRMDSWEVAPLGPLFGSGMEPAAGEAAMREEATIAAADLPTAALGRLHGSRRAARVQPTKVILDLDGEDLILTCELPTDTYITVLLDEIMKPGPATEVAEVDPEA